MEIFVQPIGLTIETKKGKRMGQTLPPLPSTVLNASGLDAVTAAVSALSDWGTLEAVKPLARYDREAEGLGQIVIGWLKKALIPFVVALALLFLLMRIPFWEQDFWPEWLSGWQWWAIWAAVVTSLGAWLYNLLVELRDTTRGTLKQLALRQRLLQAVNSQRARNRRVTGGNWRRAVCRKCLARFETSSEPLSYWRKLRFAHCRLCKSDLDCFTHVKRIEGWVDERMLVEQTQVGEAVRVNLLYRLSENNLRLPADMDELMVGNAGDRSIERFTFLYREKQPGTELPPPRRLRCRIVSDGSVSQLSRRLLNAKFRVVDENGGL